MSQSYHEAAEKLLLPIFPLASRSFLEANPISSPSLAPKNSLAVTAGGKRGSMNKTEAEFAMILEAQKRKGEILRYEFEGITLRFAGVKYTPDFFVFDRTLNWKCIEVKGPFIKGKFERAVERFRHARTYYPEFSFQLWQKTRDGWGIPKI